MGQLADILNSAFSTEGETPDFRRGLDALKDTRGGGYSLDLDKHAQVNRNISKGVTEAIGPIPTKFLGGLASVAGEVGDAVSSKTLARLLPSLSRAGWDSSDLVANELGQRAGIAEGTPAFNKMVEENPPRTYPGDPGNASVQEQRDLADAPMNWLRDLLFK